MNFLTHKRSKVLLSNTGNNTASPASANNHQKFFYKEIAKLTGSGAWSVDFISKRTYIDPEARRLLKIPENYHISLRNALDFYAEEHHDKVTSLFYKCANGNYASTAVRLRALDKSEFWVRATAEPIYNDENEIIGIRGVFQNIQNDKQKELRLVRSLKTIESQNTQLNSFTNIITHNLRSHASNLKMTLELLKDCDDPGELKELVTTAQEISEDLNTVVGHIGQLGSIQVKSKETRSMVSFEDTLRRVKRDLHMSLEDTQTEIFSDFSELPEIDYIPSYMENIFMNLITNAIKYSAEGRKPVIEIFTYKEGDDSFLMVRDNGLGIDLEKYGNRIFKMYQTFHNNKDSEGIGLFLLKNKIESLEGNISVQSKPGMGTTFTIRF